jgi:hypothetical protein
MVNVVLVLSVVSALSAQAPPARVVVARADARIEPNGTSQIVSKAGYGQMLDVQGTEGDYLKVIAQSSVRGQMRIAGFVPRQDVDPNAPPGTSTKADGIAVSADVPGASHWLTASPTRVVPVAGELASVADLSDGRAIATALAGATALPGDPSAAVSWVWLTPKGASSTVVSGARPEIMALFSHAAGMAIDEMVPALVRLVPAGDTGWSVLSMARGRADAPFRLEPDWVVAKALQQSAVAVETKASASGAITIRPTTALPAGEYAVVLRPFYGKRLSGDAIFSHDGDGLAFRACWRITIKP